MGHVEQDAILGKGGVEGRGSILLPAGQLAVIACYQVGMLCSQLLEATHEHPFGQQMVGGRERRVVDHEVDGCTEVGYIAAEGILWVGRHLQAVEVERKVRLHQWGKGGVAVRFVLTARPSHAAEGLHRFTAWGIQDRHTVATDHLLGIAIQINVLLCCVGHHCSSFLIQSNPCCSMRLASSGPPVLTMRPPMSTCTTSGFR